MSPRLVPEEPDWVTGPDGVRRVSRTPTHPVYDDPDVIRGIERVTGETFEDGEWKRPAAHCPGCRGYTAGWEAECPGS